MPEQIRGLSRSFFFSPAIFCGCDSEYSPACTGAKIEHGHPITMEQRLNAERNAPFFSFLAYRSAGSSVAAFDLEIAYVQELDSVHKFSPSVLWAPDPSVELQNSNDTHASTLLHLL